MKRDRSPWRWNVWAALSLCCLLMSCGLLLPDVAAGNVNLLLGNPSNADAFNANNYLIVRPQYVLSYNRDQGIANWASWQLNSSWLGSLPRQPFAPDLALPEAWYRVSPDDYTNSGFDRGHLVPAADRDRTAADSEAVFVMTNIIPQAPDNNRGAWERLESYCRELANQGKELYIVAGGAGIGGLGERGRKTTLAAGKVVVPEFTWKIVVVFDRWGEGVDAIAESTRAIAVVIPNRQGVSEDWRQYRTSIDAIEALTGYDFLTAIPESVQASIESQVDSL